MLSTHTNMYTWLGAKMKMGSLWTCCFGTCILTQSQRCFKMFWLCNPFFLLTSQNSAFGIIYLRTLNCSSSYCLLWCLLWLLGKSVCTSLFIPLDSMFEIQGPFLFSKRKTKLWVLKSLDVYWPVCILNESESWFIGEGEHYARNLSVLKYGYGCCLPLICILDFMEWLLWLEMLPATNAQKNEEHM